MNSAQIEQYLGFLGEKLAEMQVKTSLILLGGALMVTQFGNRKATQDIDVVIATNDRRTYTVAFVVSTKASFLFSWKQCICCIMN